MILIFIFILEVSIVYFLFLSFIQLSEYTTCSLFIFDGYFYSQFEAIKIKRLVKLFSCNYYALVYAITLLGWFKFFLHEFIFLYIGQISYKCLKNLCVCLAFFHFVLFYFCQNQRNNLLAIRKQSLWWNE
jgi:hypothetical protein